jgi:hypothetical protein
MSVPAEGGLGHSDDPLRGAFKPSRGSIRRSLDPKRLSEGESPALAAGAHKLPLRWLPDWLFSPLAKTVSVLALPALGLCRVFENPLTKREPWLPTACGAAVGGLAGWFFGLKGLLFFLLSIGLFIAVLLVFAMVARATGVEAMRRYGNPDAESLAWLARTVQLRAGDYWNIRECAVHIFATRGRPDATAEERHRVESGWPSLRSQIASIADDLDEICEDARSIEFEEAGGAIALAAATLAEAMRALVAAVDAEDTALLASQLDDDELFHIVNRLQSIVEVAAEQMAPAALDEIASVVSRPPA